MQHSNRLSEREQNVHPISIGIGAAIPHLTQLTKLVIEASSLEAVVLQGLSKLQQLQEIYLKTLNRSAALYRLIDKTLAHLPDSLTALYIKPEWCDERQELAVVLDSSNTARLRQLSGLQRLHVPHMVLADAAGLLGALSGLTSIKLSFNW
jgi:hypothetical protein